MVITMVGENQQEQMCLDMIVNLLVCLLKDFPLEKTKLFLHIL